MVYEEQSQEAPNLKDSVASSIDKFQEELDRI